MNKKLALSAVLALSATLALTGCLEKKDDAKADSKADGPVIVSIKDDACQVSTAEVPSGVVKFSLKNEGTAPNEFEILANDKLRIVGERENLGPGTTTEYTLQLEPGEYYTACKKNMVGALVGLAKFTVKDSGKKIEVSSDMKALQDAAVANYTAYVKDQAGQLLEQTRKFTELIDAGNLDEARKLYPVARQYYERIEPTAEAFGDIDPAVDEREADWQEADDKGSREWTGWHVLEKALWPPQGYSMTPEEQKRIAKKLLDDTQKLYELVYSPDFKISLDDISNGAIGLLEEVATSKITGEEEIFSHTDLWDFKANVEGAQVAFGDVEKLANLKDPELTKTIKTRFADLDVELNKYVQGDGFMSYDQLTDEQRKALSDKVNALRKPLAKLTEAIL